jgi:hypothetical protein
MGIKGCQALHILQSRQVAAILSESSLISLLSSYPVALHFQDHTQEVVSIRGFWFQLNG